MNEPRALSIPSSAIRVQRPRLARWFARLFTLGLLSPAILTFATTLGAALNLRLFWHLPEGTGTALTWAWLLGTPACALLSALLGAWAPARAGVLEVSADGVRVSGRGRSTIAAADIEAGLVVPTTSGGSVVELHLRDGRAIRAAVGGEPEAEAILDRLGLGADRRRVSVTLGNTHRSMIAGCLTFPPALVAAVAVLLTFARSHGSILVGVALGAVIAVLVPLLAHLAASPQQVVIGADAVLIHRLTGTRLVPLAAIERAEVDGTGLVLHLHARSGEQIGERITVRGTDASLATGLVERIHGAMALTRRAASAVAAAQLEPEGRPFPEWRAALGALLRRGADYRHAALGAEDLLAVLEDAAAPPARRLGAAIALREGDHPEARARVRVAAEASADGEMRAALEAAAEEEMDEGPIRRVVEGRR